MVLPAVTPTPRKEGGRLVLVAGGLDIRIEGDLRESSEELEGVELGK